MLQMQLPLHPCIYTQTISTHQSVNARHRKELTNNAGEMHVFTFEASELPTGETAVLLASLFPFLGKKLFISLNILCNESSICRVRDGNVPGEAGKSAHRSPSAACKAFTWGTVQGVIHVDMWVGASCCRFSLKYKRVVLQTGTVT